MDESQDLNIKSKSGKNSKDIEKWSVSDLISFILKIPLQYLYSFILILAAFVSYTMGFFNFTDSNSTLIPTVRFTEKLYNNLIGVHSIDKQYLNPFEDGNFWSTPTSSIIFFFDKNIEDYPIFGHETNYYEVEYIIDSNVIVIDYYYVIWEYTFLNRISENKIEMRGDLVERGRLDGFSFHECDETPSRIEELKVYKEIVNEFESSITIFEFNNPKLTKATKFENVPQWDTYSYRKISL